MKESLVLKALLSTFKDFNKMMETPIECHIKCGNLMTIVTLLIMIGGDEEVDVKLREEMGVELNDLEELIEELDNKIREHMERSLS